MNRKQRRAAPKRSSPAGGARGDPANDPAAQLFAEAVHHQRNNKLDDAARIYRRVLVLKPDHAEALNNLGAILQVQGKLREASACFAQSLWLMPQLLEQYSGVDATLLAILPPLGETIKRALAAWPNLLPPEQLLGAAELHAICDDPMLLCLLQSAPVRKIGLEALLTSLRAALIDGIGADDRSLAFGCVIARQCFINEYVFATTPDEDAKIERIKAELGGALKSGGAVTPATIAALAMYEPLHRLADAPALLERTWPAAIDDLLTQQLREPLQELQLRNTIPRLTPIDDDVSQRVRQQYEENPYPRWVRLPGGAKPVALDAHLRGKFPTAGFIPLGKTDTLDILVAGCGTGQQAATNAQDYQGARVLAVDLSLSSLAYAKRKLPARLADRLDYAQADILKLGGLGRTFDFIDVTGVLHHMRDPFEGWRILLSLLCPGGVMHLGFYSEIARRDVVAARAFIAERGYPPTASGIRRCRRDLLQTPLAGVSRYTDFFSTSECRDLLFHEHEIRVTIPAIKSFVDGHGLKFIGFDLNEAAAQKFRALFGNSGWSMSDLGRWDAIETKYPDTFATMYQFWVQKN